MAKKLIKYCSQRVQSLKNVKCWGVPRSASEYSFPLSAVCTQLWLHLWELYLQVTFKGMKWYILIKNCNNSFFCQIYCKVFLFASFKFSLSLKNVWKYLWKIICLWTNAIKNDYNLLGELLVVIFRDGSPLETQE